MDTFYYLFCYFQAKASVQTAQATAAQAAQIAQSVQAAQVFDKRLQKEYKIYYSKYFMEYLGRCFDKRSASSYSSAGSSSCSGARNIL